MREDVLLEHILTSLKDLGSKCEEIKVVQVRMEDNLAYHIKRTDLLEAQVKEQRALIDLMSAPFRFIRWVGQILKIVK